MTITKVMIDVAWSQSHSKLFFFFLSQVFKNRFEINGVIWGPEVTSEMPPTMTFEALTNWSIHSNQNTALNKKMHMDLQSGLY